MIFAFRIHSNLGSEFTQKHAQSLGNRIARWYKKILTKNSVWKKVRAIFRKQSCLKKILKKSKKFDFFDFTIFRFSKNVRSLSPCRRLLSHYRIPKIWKLKSRDQGLQKTSKIIENGPIATENEPFKNHSREVVFFMFFLQKRKIHRIFT